MRRWFGFDVAGDWCAACLDGPANATTGVLMVSGGTELACGAHGGMARVAGELADQGVAVLRFDRRGVGDSEGDDPSFVASGHDQRAALAAFRTAFPTLKRIIGYGNCDGASALLLSHLPVDGRVLTNIWLKREAGSKGAAEPSSAALRHHYAARLRSPEAWRRLLGGGINIRAMARSLFASRARDEMTDDAAKLMSSLKDMGETTTVLLASDDPTAVTFAAALDQSEVADTCGLNVLRYPSRSHSFASSDDRTTLLAAIVGQLT